MPTPIGLFRQLEIPLRAGRAWDNPAQDVRAEAEFRSRTTTHIVDAFWYGADEWRVRFSPEETGRWHWRVRSNDPGLDGCCGECECVPCDAPAPLRVAASRTHLERADGRPFFWLADTAWNGPLKASAAEWDEYLAFRAAQGFNAVQFVLTQWISAAGDAEARPAYLGRERIRIEPAFFRRMDARVDGINAAGLLAVPVLAWAAAWNPDAVHLNPGNSLPEDQLILLIRYLVARYGAHDIAWILAGDGIYTGEEAERWRRIGRAALARTSRPATMHPGGKVWVAPEYAGEPWYSFNGYQSGHWNDDANFRWINHGPPATGWKTEPLCPHINLEPCYEGHRSMATGDTINAFDVRRACWWSVLATPPAGVTYGAHGIWSWEREPELPLSHPGTGPAPAWRDALRFGGAEGAATLRRCLESIAWFRLRPAPGLVAEQPADPAAYIAAAQTPERDVAVVYSPLGGTLHLREAAGAHVECIDAATGRTVWEDGGTRSSIDTRSTGDRVLILRRQA